MDSSHDIGWIGTGALGRAIVTRLLERGRSVVVFNRTRAKVLPLVERGAIEARSPADVATRGRAVFLCLTGHDALESILFGDQGVASARPRIVVDTSTVSPDVARRTAARLGERGIAYVDCPVSGGPEGASRGALTALVSGEPSACDAAIPIVREFASTVLPAGGHGAAQTIKVVNNLAESINLWGAAEAFALGERAGIDRETLLRALEAMRGHSIYMGVLAERLRRPREDVSASLDVRVKDLHLARELARRAGQSIPLGEATLDLFSRAAGSVGGGRDQTECWTHLHEEHVR